MPSSLATENALMVSVRQQYTEALVTRKRLSLRYAIVALCAIGGEFASDRARQRGGSVTGAEPTDDSVDAITDALLVVSRVLVAISARSIAHVDQTLTIPQFRTLVIMSNIGPVKLTRLAQLLGLPPDTVAQMVQPLVSAGLVVRAADSALSWDTVADLSRRGRTVVNQVTTMRRAEIANVVSMIPLHQRRGLVTALSAFSVVSRETVVDVDDLL